MNSLQEIHIRAVLRQKLAAEYESADAIPTPNQLRKKNFFQRHPYWTTFLGTPGAYASLPAQYLDQRDKAGMSREELDKRVWYRNPRTLDASIGALVSQVAGLGRIPGAAIGTLTGSMRAASRKNREALTSQKAASLYATIYNDLRAENLKLIVDEWKTLVN